ncbi:lamin tail domain-containing protein [bacterium]|nr:lamin tail domain-containing protein [bacterium]
MRLHRKLLLLVLAILILAPSAFAQVILNEIMYNPEGDDYHTEYIELYNLGDEPVFLYEWRISDSQDIDYLLPQPGSNQMTIAAGGYAVIIDPGYWEHDSTLYQDQIPADALLLTIDDSRFGFTGLTNRSSLAVELLNDDGEMVSRRTYRPDAENGISEERILPTGNEYDDNWAFSAPGGTPGYLNSVTPVSNDLSVLRHIIQVDYFEYIDRNTVYTEWVVRNEGRDTSEVRQLTFRLRSEYSDFDSTLGSLTINESSPEYVTTIPKTFGVRVPVGYYILQAVLSPEDDIPENDTTQTAVFLKGKIDLTDDWFAFSEVMLNPPNSPSGAEWIELRVTHDEPFNPSGWGVMDAAGVVGWFPQNSILLQPDSLYVLAENASVLYWDGIREEQMIVPDEWPQLNNYGEVLTLVTPDSSEYLSVGVSNGDPGVSMHWYDGTNTENSWHPTHYAPFATPGRENWIVYPERDIAIDSINCLLETGNTGTVADDTLQVTIIAGLDGWFIKNDVAWTVTATLADLTVPLGTFTSVAPEPTGSTIWTEKLDPSPLSEPGEWTITAEFVDSDADLDNNRLSTTVEITETYEPVVTGSQTHVVEVTPNPFSPDGDGYEDITEFRFDYPAEMIVITVRLFDSGGRPLGTIARDVQLPGTGSWAWDGRSGLSNGSYLPLGLYAYVIDIRSTDGEQRWRVKGALASAGGR